MNIFEKRPLCLILCIGLGGFLLFSFENKILKIVLVAIAILLGIISIFYRKDNHKRLLTAASISVLIGCLLSFLYFDNYFKAYNLYDDNIEVVGYVEEVSSGSSSYTNRILVKVETINGKTKRGYYFYAYPTKTECEGIIEGTKIYFKASLDDFSDESYTYNISKGINAYASDISDIEIIEYTYGSLRLRIARIKEYLTRYTMKLSNEDTGAILSALLLGERDYLPDQLRLDFKRIGISHILALSGMHLAILSLGIGKALSLFGVKKKLRITIIAIFVFVYMALTGFSVSVVRAGIMLILSSILYLMSRSKDSLTSLSVAVLVICIINPNSIMDISLWLSALATFGIVAFGEISSTIKNPKDKIKKAVRYFILAILASVFAISATIAVSSASFGGFSLLAPITTIIFSFLAEIIMYLGCVMMLIGWLIPIGWIIRPLCKLMTVLAGAFSSWKLSYVSSNFTPATVMIIIYMVLFYLFLIVNLKKPLRALNILIVLYAISTLLPTVLTIKQNNTETVAYYSDYKCDELLIRSENEVCLINSAQYGKSVAYTSLDFLESANVTYLDKYYLTHYSWSIDDEIKLLMYNIAVDEIYLPNPRNDDEEAILKTVIKAVENSRTSVVIYQEYETVGVGEYAINLLYSVPYGKTSMNAFAVSKGHEVYTYISSGLLDESNKESFIKYLPLTDHLILGDHGKKYKDKIYIADCYEDLNSIVIHSDNIFLKQNNMQYYIEKGCEIFSHPNNIIYYVGK